MKRCMVAATQVDARHLEIDHNLELHLQLIAETAEAGCDLVVFPETSVNGNNGSPDVTRFAEPHDGRIYHALRQQAATSGIVVSYGFCELFRGTHYNTSALVGPDGLIGLQRKVHASYDEFFRFRQAYEWAVYDLGFCRVGTAICHDSDFFESWRILALKGAELVLLPHANRTMPAGGGELTFDGRGRRESDERMLSAQRELLEDHPWPPRLHDVMARDNGVFAVFSDQVGFDGHSQPRRRRLRAGARRVDARAIRGRHRDRLDLRRARSRAARTGAREPVVRAQEAASRGLRGARDTAVNARDRHGEEAM